MLFEVFTGLSGLTFGTLFVLTHSTSGDNVLAPLFLVGAVICFGSAFQLLPREVEKVTSGEIELLPVSGLLASSQGREILASILVLSHLAFCSLYGHSFSRVAKNWFLLIVLGACVVYLTNHFQVSLIPADFDGSEALAALEKAQKALKAVLGTH